MSDNLEIDRLIADIERRQDRESALIDRLHETRTELAALRARIDRAFVMAATKNGVIRTGTNAFNPGKRVALVPLDD